MSKSDAFENDWLNLTFKGIAIANIADNAAASPLTNLYYGLHSSDPTDAGNQSSNEIAYTGYARKPVARGAGFVVTGNSVSPAADVVFAACTGGTATATHFSIGVAVSGATKILYSGPLSASIAISNTIVPIILASGSNVTED